MKILMLVTQRGSPDGVTVNTYREGEEYDLTGTPRERELAEVFVREGWATTNATPPAAPALPAEVPAAETLRQQKRRR